MKPPQTAALLSACAAALCLCAAAPAPAGDLDRAKEAAARGSEAKALAIAVEALQRQQPPDRELFIYATELLPEHKTPQAAALAAVARARLEKPGDDPAWDLGLCKALRVSGRAAEAVPHCRKAQGTDPLSYPAYRELGLAYGAAGNSAKALEALRRAADLAPAGCQARLHLGAAQEKTADYAGARASFAAALKLAAADPALETKFCKARAAAALRRLDRRAAEAKARLPVPAPPDKERRYAACLGKFRDAAGADRLLDAADTAARCLKLIPDDPPLAAELAPVLVRLGRYEDGVKEYERAAALNKADKPKAAQLHVKAAETWLKLGDHRKAISQYRLAAEAAPGDLACLHALAETLDARSMFADALEVYEKVLKSDPRDSRARMRAEELRTGLLTNDQIIAELRFRRALDPKKITLQPEDIKFFKALRAAELSGGADFVRARAVSAKGLFVQRETPDGTRVLLSDAGYRAYVSLATRDAVALFERQKVGMREIFKLRNGLGEPVFDKDGRLTPEGAVVWRKALDGEKAWLMPYEAVPESPKAVQAAKDLSDLQRDGYAEISEPEYIWLQRYTNCPVDVLTGEVVLMKIIDDGARVRYLVCTVPTAMCMNPTNKPLPLAINDYRDGNDKISEGASTSFFGIAGAKKNRMCEKGRLWAP